MTQPALLNGAPDTLGRIEKLETDFAILAWLYAELMHQIRVTAIKQALANPAVQEQISQQLLAQMG